MKRTKESRSRLELEKEIAALKIKIAEHGKDNGKDKRFCYRGSPDDQDKLDRDSKFVTGILELLYIGIGSGEAQSIEADVISTVIYEAAEKMYDIDKFLQTAASIKQPEVKA